MNAPEKINKYERSIRCKICAPINKKNSVSPGVFNTYYFLSQHVKTRRHMRLNVDNLSPLDCMY